MFEKLVSKFNQTHPDIQVKSILAGELDKQLPKILTAVLGILYRPNLFEAAVITETPKTWEDLREVAKKLTVDKNGDNIPEQYGMLLPLGKEEWTVFSWFPFLLSGEGEIVTNSRPNLTNPGAIEALEFWETLINKPASTQNTEETIRKKGI